MLSGAAWAHCWLTAGPAPLSRSDKDTKAAPDAAQDFSPSTLGLKLLWQQHSNCRPRALLSRAHSSSSATQGQERAEKQTLMIANTFRVRERCREDCSSTELRAALPYTGHAGSPRSFSSPPEGIHLLGCSTRLSAFPSAYIA